MKKSLQLCLLTLASTILPLSSYAAPVNIDTSIYGGVWNLDKQGRVTGSTTVDLDAGNHEIFITNGAYIYFSTDADGNVTTSTPTSSTASGNTLSFLASSIAIDPVDFVGSYTIGYSYSWMTGSKTVALVNDMSYIFKVGLFGSASIKVNADGTVTSLSPDAFEANGTTLTMRNSTLVLDRGLYTGSYRLWYATPSFDAQQSTVTVVPGVSYQFGISGSGINFKLDADGNVVKVTKPNSLEANGNLLTLKTVPIVIDPVDFKGRLYVSGVSDFSYGVQTIELVPAIGYAIKFGYEFNNVRIYLDDLGDIRLTNKPNVLSYAGKTVTLNNIDIELTAEDADFEMQPYFAGPSVIIAAGETKRFTMIPNIKHRADVKNINGVYSPTQRTIEVQDPCTVIPGSADYRGFTINFSCPSLIVDIDEDNIPDESDNCPLIANEDQLNFDNDEFGDVCDSDMDGDSVTNTLDNCPADPNLSQLDLDLDGLGDACDSDIDNDGIEDVVDNCPAISNSGQGNSDGDLQGDACDSDDDNDNIPDQFDNCPIASNADQNDVDGDGEGDICDGDVDGDAVLNDIDQCPTTPAHTAVNVEGCSGAEFIAMTCVAGNFKNHGQYVKCVTQTASDAVGQALITNKEKSIFVRQAAKNK